MPGINAYGILEILLCVLPGMAVSIFTNDMIWLTASFFAVCSLNPYNKSYFNRVLPFAHLVFIFFIGYLLSLLLHGNQYFMYGAGLLFVGLICGYIEFYMPDLRKATSWILIGIIYSSFKFIHFPASFSWINLIEILLISGLSLFIALRVRNPKKIHYHLSFIFQKEYIPFYLRIFFPLLITLIVWHVFKLKEGEWLLWSCISVANIELDAAKKKAKQRLLGGSIGVLIGFLVSMIIPNNQIINYIIFTCIMLSFRSFNNYFIAFTIRCFLIVLFSNDHFHIGLTRISNVFIGAVIGYTCSIVLVKLQNSFGQKIIPESEDINL